MATKPRKKMGRPSKMTEARIQRLEEAFAWGCSDTEACLWADVSTTALYEYQKRYPGFKERKDILKCAPTIRARKTVLVGLETDPNLAFKYLVKRRPDEFSEKNQVELSGNNQTPINVTIQSVKAAKNT